MKARLRRAYLWPRTEREERLLFLGATFGVAAGLIVRGILEPIIG